MQLGEIYALHCGTKIEKPFVLPLYFPIPFDQYATIHVSSGMQAKNYDYWQDVVDEILPYLQEKNLPLIQIGEQNDYPIIGAIDLRGQTKLRQTFYILKHTSLHFGNDSFPIHLCSAYNKKLLAIYSVQSYKNCGPIFGDSDKQVLIESNRNGDKPSYSSEENPKTINFINPEEIVDGLAKLLDVKLKSKIQTIYNGSMYVNKVIDFIPNCIFDINLPKDSFYNIRNDYDGAQEDMIYRNLHPEKKFCIFTEKPLNLDILKQLRNNINIIYKIYKQYDLDFLKKLHSSGIPYNIHCYINRENFLDKLLDFIELNPILFFKEKTKEDISNLHLINKDTKFKSSKIIYSNNKLYPSLSHMKKDIPIKNPNIKEEFTICDDDDFWKNLDFFRLYNRIS